MIEKSPNDCVCGCLRVPIAHLSRKARSAFDWLNQQRKKLFRLWCLGCIPAQKPDSYRIRRAIVAL